MRKTDAYQVITDRILALLEAGTVPWHKPWNAETGMPKNLASGKPYRGINVFMLGTQHYGSPYWLTFKQCKAPGGSVKRGEKSTPVVFWKISEYQHENDDGETETRKSFLLRYYNVFNVEQCEGIDAPTVEDVEHDHEPIPHCEQIVTGMPNAPSIEHREAQAYFRPRTDTVNMPKLSLFDTPEEYYSTLFHELTHSTGHKSRLNRKTLTDICPFGSINYSKEELCAEMGAAYLCGTTGIENRTIDKSAAYINGWLAKLRRDPKVLVNAAAQAQKAADHIMAMEVTS